MMDRRVIGRVVYDTYDFRRLGASCRDLYTYLVLNADNDGVCDIVHDIMTLNKCSDNDLRSLIESQYVLPLMRDNEPNIIVWLPDFLRFNVIQKTKGYAPSRYRDMLRDRYPWAPVLIVKNNKNTIRMDILNDNDNLSPDPRNGMAYETPIGQRKQIVNMQPEGLPRGDLPHKINKEKKNEININESKISEECEFIGYVPIRM